MKPPAPPATDFRLRTHLRVGKATLYGTDWCGYTTRQKQAFTNAGIPFDYVNCEKSPDQCQGIHGYPVVKDFPNPGDRWDGFRALLKG